MLQISRSVLAIFSRRHLLIWPFVIFMISAIEMRSTNLGLRSFESPMNGHVHDVILKTLSVSLSESLFNTEHDYTYITDVFYSIIDQRFGASWTYQSEKTIDSSIDYLRTAEVNRKNLSIILGEDVGLADYINASFVVFGVHFSSLFKMYFLLLFISSILYFYDFRREPVALSAGITYLASMYAMLPAMIQIPELSGLFSNRTFPALSMLALMHVIIRIWRTPQFERKTMFCLLCQLCLITLSCHVRISAAWQVSTILIVALGTLLFDFARSRGVTVSRALHAGAPAVLSVLLLFGVHAATKLSLSDRYSNGSEHCVWHMALWGLAFHPDAGKHGIAADDGLIAAAVNDHFSRHPSRFHSYGIYSAETDLTPFKTGKWTNYEIVARDMFLDIAAHNPRFTAEAMVRKGVITLNVIFKALNWPISRTWLDEVSTKEMQTTLVELYYDAKARPIKLFMPICVFMLVVAATHVLLGRPSEGKISEYATLWALSLALLAGSAAPDILTAPIPHGMLETIILFIHLFYFTLLLFPLLFAFAWRRIFAKRDGQQPSLVPSRTSALQHGEPRQH